MKIAYLCDGKADGCRKNGCGKYCIRTTNPDHALFGRVDDPAKAPERFGVFDNDLYYEREPVGREKMKFGFVRLHMLGRRTVRMIRELINGEWFAAL